MIALEHFIAALVLVIGVCGRGRSNLPLAQVVELVTDRVELGDRLLVVAVKLLDELRLLAESILILLHHRLVRAEQGRVGQQLSDLAVELAGLAQLRLLLDLIQGVLSRWVELHDSD